MLNAIDCYNQCSQIIDLVIFATNNVAEAAALLRIRKDSVCAVVMFQSDSPIISIYSKRFDDGV